MATKIIKNQEKLFCFCSKWNAISRIWGSKTKWDIKNDNEDELNNNLFQQLAGQSTPCPAQMEMFETKIRHFVPTKIIKNQG